MVKNLDKIGFLQVLGQNLYKKMTYSNLFLLKMIKWDNIAFLQILTIFGTL